MTLYVQSLCEMKILMKSYLERLSKIVVWKHQGISTWLGVHNGCFFISMPKCFSLAIFKSNECKKNSRWIYFSHMFNALGSSWFAPSTSYIALQEGIRFWARGWRFNFFVTMSIPILLPTSCQRVYQV